MSEQMDIRTSKLEWEVESLKDELRRQADSMAELSIRMDMHHREVMEAISSLKEGKSREQGAAEARAHDAEGRQRLLKWVSAAIAILTLGLAFGWIQEAEGSWLHVSAVTDAPIPVQYHTRDVP